MKRAILILMLLATMSSTATAKELYVYDFGNGTYVATTVQGIGEWIVKLYYLLYDDSGDDDEYVCPPNS